MANQAIKIEIKNLPQIKRAFSKAPRLMSDELNKAIRESAQGILRGEKQEYRSLGIRIITHGLMNSISRGLYFSNLRGEVGPNVTGSPGVPYAGFVHSGTRFMKGRPFLLNSVKTAEPTIDKLFTKAVDNVLSKIAREV